MIDLSDTAARMLDKGKGILAADESNATADKRLASYGIGTGEEMRRKFRDLFLSAPGIEAYLSGVILYTETLTQKTDKGVFFPDLLCAKGIVPGIKVDEGLAPFPESPDESITKGLIGLPERLAEYRDNCSIRFTKWRAVVSIDGTRLPTAQVIHENAKRLASYAYDVQNAGMVPILEPEVLLEGKHPITRAREVLKDTLSTLMSTLEDQAVDTTGIVLKTAMALSGNKSGRTDTPEEVAKATVDTLLATIPANVSGIVFLSGGQSTEQATENLAAITRYAKAAGAPWPLTFSYARALQDEALTAWGGKDENVPAARAVFIERLKKEADAIHG